MVLCDEGEIYYQNVIDMNDDLGVFLCFSMHNYSSVYIFCDILVIDTLNNKASIMSCHSIWTCVTNSCSCFYGISFLNYEHGNNGSGEKIK